MKYNIHSFRIATEDDKVEYLEDVTSMAHSFLEREYNIIVPTFDASDDAKLYARAAALFIARKRRVNNITYVISGHEDNSFSLEYKKADYFKEYELSINEEEVYGK